MNCLNPSRIVNPAYKAFYRELKAHDPCTAMAILVKKFPHDHHVEIPCGTCEACLVRRSNEWAFRLKQEYLSSKNCFFITLTYDEMSLPRTTIAVRSKDAFMNYLNGGNYYEYFEKDVPTFSKSHCKTFIKNLRNHYGNGLRYFLASEYGSINERPHYHMLLFNVPEKDNQMLTLLDLEKQVRRIWNKGRIDVKPVIDERIVYTAKYSLSNLDRPKYYPKPFILASRRPMIGFAFLKKNVVHDYRSTLKSFGVDYHGQKFPLSRVYKYKIFDSDMRAQIYDEQLKNAKDITQAEKDGYKVRIRRNFKKSHVI